MEQFWKLHIVGSSQTTELGGELFGVLGVKNRGKKGRGFCQFHVPGQFGDLVGVLGFRGGQKLFNLFLESPGTVGRRSGFVLGQCRRGGQDHDEQSEVCQLAGEKPHRAVSCR